MKRTAIEIFLVVFISCFVIFYKFNQVPQKISFDEAEFTNLALSLNNKNYTPYSELATGHSTLYFYVLLASFKTLGVNNFALRFPSALFGLINVVLVYLIARVVFEKNSRIPFLITFIFVAMRWYFSFARFSFEATFLLFLELFSIYFLFIYQTHKNLRILLIISSLFAGLAFLSYYPGRIFILLPLLFLFANSDKSALKQDLLYYLIIFALVTFPLTSYLLTHKDIRFQEQLFLTDNKLSISTKIEYLKQNINKSVLMFNIRGDMNGRHNYPGKPMLNPIEGIFFIFGLFITIFLSKISYGKFFLFYFFISILPLLFTYPIENPNSLRSFTAILPIVFFIGNGFAYLFQKIKELKISFYFAYLGFLFIFLFSFIYNLRTYFYYEPKVFKQAFDLNQKLDTILKLKLWENLKSL